MLVIGLMSGTSLDGIDAALVEIGSAPGVTGTGVAPAWSVRAFLTVPYRVAERSRIQRSIEGGGAAELCRLHTDLGEWLAAAALAVCDSAGVSISDVDLIGSHGQTIWHIPPEPGTPGSTLQLGSPATIAERTGVPVVSDFRSRDIAAGGEGAPLVPWVDQLLFSVPGRRRVLLNIGGMANLTWLPPAGDPDPVLAFDTGPGNVLIDAAVELATGGAELFDRGGRLAAAGRVDDVVLTELLAHPYLQLAPPRSTGRELFGRPFVERLAERIAPGTDQGWADLIATLTAFTAFSIADSIRDWVSPRQVDEVVVSGGGAQNAELCRQLRAQLGQVPLHEGGVLGVDPDAKEALAFAILAWAYQNGMTANLPEVTGAAGPRVLGSYTPGKEGR